MYILEAGKAGLLFEPGNAEDLAAKVRWMVENEDAVREMGQNARAEFEVKYTPEINYRKLVAIYDTVIAQVPAGH